MLKSYLFLVVSTLLSTSAFATGTLECVSIDKSQGLHLITNYSYEDGSLASNIRVYKNSKLLKVYSRSDSSFKVKGNTITIQHKNQKTVYKNVSCSMD